MRKFHILIEIYRTDKTLVVFDGMEIVVFSCRFFALNNTEWMMLAEAVIDRINQGALSYRCKRMIMPREIRNVYPAKIESAGWKLSI